VVAVKPAQYRQRDAQIAALIDGGLTYGQVAKKLGVTRNVVAGALHRLSGKHLRPNTAQSPRKISVVGIIDIRVRHARGERLDSIAADYGVSKFTVCRIGRRRVWAHIEEAT
jgi:hypothetical protein